MAVLAVIAYHTGAISGGFVGVDVFFVISGFLITRLLWSEAAATGRIGLARFYAGRARRLLPAAATVLVATAVAAVALLPPLRARSTLDDGLAAALYVGNYRFAISGTDYLGHTDPSPFQHYWSLGVEEQFYLLWPVLLIGLAWAVRRSRPGWALAAVLAIAAGSFALSVLWTAESPPWAFFSLPTRAWELSAGALIALSAQWWRRMPAGPAALAGLTGLGLIGWSALRMSTATAFPGTAALVPVAGAVLVIAAGCAVPTRGAGRWLSTTGMRILGRLSYSWYLWHWPVLIFAPLIAGHALGWTGRAVAVAISLVLAVLTLRYVEHPLRYARPLRRSSVRSLALGSAVTAAAVSAALLLPMFVPAPVGRGTPASAALVHPASRPGADPVDDAVATVAAAVAASADQAAVPAALSPPLAAAAGDKPEVFRDGCVRSWRETGVPECLSGDTAGTRTVALVGDSHAAMWQPALDAVAAQQHWRLVTMAKVTCPLQDLPITSPYLGRAYTECVQWRAEAMQHLVGHRPNLVVLSMSRRYGADFGFTAFDAAWLRTLTALVAEIRAATGARILVLGPVPDPHTTVPVCLSDHLDDARACSPERAIGLNDAGIAAEADAVGRGGGRYASLADLFCTASRCPVIVGTDLVFRDDNHVTVSYARRLSPVLGLLAARALAPPS